MEFASSAFGVGLLKIIGIDIVLSGDNALVIALACRSLPTEKRKWGVLMGSVDRRRRNSLGRRLKLRSREGAFPVGSIVLLWASGEDARLQKGDRVLAPFGP